MTELDAINIMLRGIGQAPITSSGLQHPHAITAAATLEQINIEVQEEGWWFNEDEGLSLAVNDAGEIIVPSNALNVDPSELNSPAYDTSHLVQRGNKLYDPKNSTFVIGEAVVCDIRYLLDYENLPTIAQRYIAYYAALEFHSDIIGDTNKLQVMGNKVRKLEISLKTQDINNRNTNAQLSPNAARLLSGVVPVQRRT